MRSVVIRVPLVYGRRGALFQSLIAVAQAEGFGRYIGSGENKWSTIHVDDLAELYVRALEQAPAGSVYIAAAGPPVSMKAIAEALGRRVGANGNARSWSKEAAGQTIGELFATILTLNSQVSGAKATRELGWHP